MVRESESASRKGILCNHRERKSVVVLSERNREIEITLPDSFKREDRGLDQGWLELCGILYSVLV
jgi:hypothetical protein